MWWYPGPCPPLGLGLSAAGALVPGGSPWPPQSTDETQGGWDTGSDGCSDGSGPGFIHLVSSGVSPTWQGEAWAGSADSSVPCAQPLPTPRSTPRQRKTNTGKFGWGITFIVLRSQVKSFTGPHQEEWQGQGWGGGVSHQGGGPREGKLLYPSLEAIGAWECGPALPGPQNRARSPTKVLPHRGGQQSHRQPRTEGRVDGTAGAGFMPSCGSGAGERPD